MLMRFSMSAVLNSAADVSMGADWTKVSADVTVTDFEGVFTESDVAVGDVFYFDTGPFETGTLSKYVVTAVTATTPGGGVVFEADYDPTNDNISVPDLGYSAGTVGFVSRVTPNNALVYVPSPGMQLIPDRLGTYAKNSEALLVLDGLAGSNAVPRSSTLTVATAGDTVFTLPFSAKATKKAESSVSVNALEYPYGDGTTWEVAGTTFTWSGPYILYPTDKVVFNYFS